jgi:FKBP-type peptidyl-prolyl cis-trans isomerase
MRLFISMTTACIAALASCASAAPAPVSAPVAIDVAAPSTSASAVQVLPTPAPSAPEKKSPPVAFVGDKVLITVIAPGSGPSAKSGDFLLVNYVGSLLDGTEFDSSLKAGRQPFKFKLGMGYVIKGWEQGVVGMQVGEKRKIVIPPALGYGERGMSPKIPPGAELVFEIELLAINPP